MDKINGQLLYILNEESGLLIKKLVFYKVNFNNNWNEILCSIPASRLIRFLSCFRLFNRLLRLEPKCVERLTGDVFIVGFMHKIWRLNIREKTFVEIYCGRHGFSDAINFCNINGFVYWGDYGKNSNYEPVNIYRTNGYEVRKMYTFPAGEVLHIHNIIPDKNSDNYWILAGDNESQAGIYKVNSDWTKIEPWKTGKQCYRAVMGFSYKGGLVYATDSVETENHLRFIEKDGTEHILTTINGSCMTGGETRGFYFFSTAVEPYEGTGFWRKFTFRLGGGIKNREVHVVSVNKENLKFEVIKVFQKDLLPMALFLYGRVRFCKGQEAQDEYVWAYPEACRKYDGKTIKIEL